MGKEIERKFLVNGNFKHNSIEHFKVVQAYISSIPERSVRIRIISDKAFITIKGATNKSGTTRYEWEKEINTTEAKELLLMCEPGIIEKTRYLVPVGKYTFEVDEFHGQNAGLVLAEIELPNENETYSKPNWLGEEVTGNEKYYNTYLSKSPFTNW